jgi:hypothetical protein
MIATAVTAPDARAAIVHQAIECEKALRLAAFVESESSLSNGIAVGMRKMAVYHSERAFGWAGTLARQGGAK